MSISYQITPVPEEHVYRVKLFFTATATSHLLKLPVWIPGSYMIREFSKNISQMEASQAGSTPQLQQFNKNCWELSSLRIGDGVEVNYCVYAYEYGIRSAFLDTLRGYFNPSSLCITLSGAEDFSHRVVLNGLPDGWQVCCGLKLAGVEFIAENYDELIDSPFEIGTYLRLEFTVANVTHYLILSGTIPHFNKERLLNDITKVCAYQLNLFGGQVPYANYTFILNLSGEIYTGLEHRNSTLLMAPYFALPNCTASNDEDYHKLMGLISHEFFHTWNVKRIKPKAFSPYALDHENYTKLLWWFEGVTSYYDDLVLYRCGIINLDKYLGRIVDNLNHVYKFNGVTKQTLANSSLTSWVKYYRQDEDSPNSIVSYYVKGALVAVCLDLLIRRESQFSLDDVLRYLYKCWQTNPQGIDEAEIPSLIQNAVGIDLSAFIHLACETSEALPFSELFAEFGLQLTKRPGKNHQDSGKYNPPSASTIAENLPLDLGAKLEKSPLGYLVKNVYNHGSAEIAGLAVNDLIVAINQIKLTQLEKQLGFYQAGESVELTVFRQDRQLSLELTLATSVATIINLTLCDETALARWL